MQTRTTQPKNNKYYIRQVSGGYNGAVAGQPTVSTANVLCNCFGGETKYVTDEGLKTFIETVGTVQNVLNENGEFAPAEIKSFGKQKLFKVTFNNGYVVYATDNHRWVVDRFSSYHGKKYKKRVIKTTLELNNADYIPYNFFKGNDILDADGIVHGIVFGDGCKNSNCATYQVQLFGDKEELKKYLPKHIYSDHNLKEVPSIHESEEYLRGFVAGLIATDGTVAEDTFNISNVSLDVIKQIEQICYKIGIRIGGVYSETRDVKVGNYEYKDHTIYYLTFKRKGIEKLLIKTSDKLKLKDAYKDIKYTRIKSIESTDRFEEVYCAVEPVTHTITLEKNILTGQCVGYANGRFNEIGAYGKCKYQLVCNAENFIESAKQQGLKISDVPIQGGIMVWQKGATLGGGDGAGHVAVVEEIYDDGTILTSESGWNAWAFKTIRRDNTNGRWGQNSAYKFRGCIINPAVKNPQILPTPKLVVDGIGGANTIRAMQKYFSTPQDGVLSGQNKALNKYYPSIIAVEYGKGGSTCVKKLQKWVGTTQDGILGEKTIKAWQKKIGVTADGIFGVNSMKAWQKYLNDRLFAENTEPTGPPKPPEPIQPIEPTPTASVYKVIDVSDWQGQIDWKKVKADGVVGAIIRYGDGNVLDKRFAENMKNAKAAGLHIGSYIFSRAKTKAKAEEDAVRLFNACSPYEPDMPLYIDLEVASLAKYANTVAQAFLNKMKSLGGRGGVYANLNWWNNYLVDTAKNYSANPFWIAQYNDKMTHKNPSLFGMWQYSSSGKVNGISGKVDMDICYVAYWETVQKETPQDKICAEAKEIADSKKYVYKKFSEEYGKDCAICKPHDGKNLGWNCIGYPFHCWHVVTGCKCSCQVMTNQLWEKVLKSSAKNALSIVKERTNLTDVEVIIDKNGISESKLKKGDIIAYFNGDTYVHTALYLGDGKIADCTSGRTPGIKYGVKSYSKWKVKVAIRYTGK